MMKKSIFAVAVASVLTLGAAQAETVLYGSIRYDYESKKNEHAYNILDKDKKFVGVGFTGTRLSNLSDAGSRIGIKGSEDLGNGNAVIFNLEYGFDGMTNDEKDGSKFTTRKAVLGLTGDWGTFAAGRQDNPFKQTLVDDHVVDGFNGSNVITSASQRAMTTALTGQVASGNYLYFNAKGKLIETAGSTAAKPQYAYAGHLNLESNQAAGSRVGKVIAYVTPNLAGFQASAALMMDEDLYETNDQKSIDLWTINAQYAYDLGANGTILTKAGYINAKLADDNSSKIWGLFLGYSQDAFAVTGSYASGDHSGNWIFKDNNSNSPAGAVGSHTGKSKSKGWDLGASFSFGSNYFSTVRATYGQSELKNLGNKDKVKSWAVGFEQKLSTRTRAWVEYGNEETSFSFHNVDKRKNSVLSVGMRHDF